MSTAGRAGVPLAALRRATRTRPAPATAQRCDMCAAPIEPEHPHVVDLQSRALMCSCRPCYLLFTDVHADLRYRAVPERYLSFPGPALDERSWDELQIPVGLAFLFRNSVQGRLVAFYPGPAGATESELPLAAWERIVAQNPRFTVLRDDVEALLVRRPGGSRGPGAPGAVDPADGACHLVPIDACYELVGQLRMLWRGFDGGREAHDAIDAFFTRVRARSRPAPPAVSHG
jgi:Family of unknown function (DUF5947)